MPCLLLEHMIERHAVIDASILKSKWPGLFITFVDTFYYFKIQRYHVCSMHDIVLLCTLLRPNIVLADYYFPRQR